MLSHRLRSYLGSSVWASLLCLSLFASTGWAQPLSEVFTDEGATAFARRLLETQAADSQLCPKLIGNNPGLTRRAFVLALVQVDKLQFTDLKGAQAWASLAARIASDIDLYFSDPEPTHILDDIAASHPEVFHRLLAYWDLHRLNKRPLPNDNDVEDRYWESPDFPADLDPQTRAAMEPLLRKGLRVAVAEHLSHPRLLITELESYEEVAQKALSQLPQEERDAITKDYRHEMMLTKLFFEIDLGLTEDLPRRIESFREQADEPQTESELWLAGFRAAARQGQWNVASNRLEQAQSALGDSSAGPILRFCLATASYQLRRAQGFQPSTQQAFAEFSSAWSILDEYTPTTLIADDFSWPAGRAAIKFWLDQFQQFPEGQSAASELVLSRIKRWLYALDSQHLELSSEAILWHQDEFYGHQAYVLALLDVSTYFLETSKTSLPRDELIGAVSQLRSMHNTVALGSEDELFQFAGQPRFEVRSAGFMPELSARLYYLESLADATPTAARIDLLRQAQGEILKTENPEPTVKYLILFGREFASLASPADAKSCWIQALEQAQKYSFVEQSAEVASLLAELSQKAGQWEEAGRYAAIAKENLQDSLPLLGVRNPSGRKAAEQAWRATKLQTQAAIAKDEPEQAWSALTQGQQLQTATLRMEGEKQAQADGRKHLATEQGVATISREVERLKSLPTSPIRDELINKGEKLLADNRARFLTESRALRQKYSDIYGKILKVDPLSLADIKANLPKDLAIVSYFPTNDALYIFLVTSEAFRLHQVAVNQSELDAKIMSFLRTLRRARPEDQSILVEDSETLYQWLIGPVEASVSSSKTLLLIPTGRLNSVPFACLTDEAGKPLAASKSLVELAKATDLHLMASSRSQTLESVVTFANATGDLPSAAVEGQQITKFFPKAKLFTGDEATKAAFMTVGDQGQVLHLATHGEWNLEDSLQNYLALANEEKVSQDEIFSLDLSQKSLVMLSACNTAMGEGQGQNYVASLAEAFWLAGSRSVVASLWAVNDESTSLLMIEFYRSLRAGDSKAEALRKAQMTVSANPKFSHPYYWSGFVLFGDWK